MKAQGISRYYHGRVYEEYTAPVRELTTIFSLDRIARAYFWGQTEALTAAMEWRWGNQWHAVAAFTTDKKKDKALEWIKKLEAEHVERMRRGPKGDFPDPGRVRQYAQSAPAARRAANAG
jgi:hypothetical protein